MQDETETEKDFDPLYNAMLDFEYGLVSLPTDDLTARMIADGLGSRIRPYYTRAQLIRVYQIQRFGLTAVQAADAWFYQALRAGYPRDAEAMITAHQQLVHLSFY